MNYEWSLDVLYKGYDDPDFAKDMERLDESLARTNEFAEKIASMPPREALLEYIKQGEEDQRNKFSQRYPQRVFLHQLHECSVDERSEDIAIKKNGIGAYAGQNHRHGKERIGPVANGGQHAICDASGV